MFGNESQKSEQNLSENVYYFKFKVNNKNTDFDCWQIGANTEESLSKISNIEVAILLFSYQICCLQYLMIGVSEHGYQSIDWYLWTSSYQFHRLLEIMYHDL